MASALRRFRGAVSESGRFRQGAGGHPRGNRRRSVLMLPTLPPYTLCRRSTVHPLSGQSARKAPGPFYSGHWSLLGCSLAEMSMSSRASRLDRM